MIKKTTSYKLYNQILLFLKEYYLKNYYKLMNDIQIFEY